MALSFKAGTCKIFLDDLMLWDSLQQWTPPASSWFLVHQTPQVTEAAGHQVITAGQIHLSLSVSASSLISFPAFHVLPPLTTHSPIMINDLEPLTSPLAPSPLPILLFLRFLQRLAGTESRRSGGREEGVAVAGWMEDRWSPARGRLRGQASHKSTWRVHPGLAA